MIPKTFVLSILVALAVAIHSKPATAQTNITAADCARQAAACERLLVADDV